MNTVTLREFDNRWNKGNMYTHISCRMEIAQHPHKPWYNTIRPTTTPPTPHHHPGPLIPILPLSLPDDIVALNHTKWWKGTVPQHISWRMLCVYPAMSLSYNRRQLRWAPLQLVPSLPLPVWHNPHPKWHTIPYLVHYIRSRVPFGMQSWYRWTRVSCKWCG